MDSNNYQTNQSSRTTVIPYSAATSTPVMSAEAYSDYYNSPEYRQYYQQYMASASGVAGSSTYPATSYDAYAQQYAAYYHSNQYQNPAYGKFCPLFF